MNHHHRYGGVVGNWQRGSASLFVFIGLWATPCGASEWARKMFETTFHDFGMIAAGAEAEYKFTFKNHLVSDVHVARVYRSCGCVSVRIENSDLKTYERSAIIASVNSRSIRASQRSTITVVFDRPAYAQVQLDIKVYIRGDVVVEPTSVAFGEVDLGVAAKRTVKVTHYGNRNWRILDARGSADYLEASLSEPAQNGSRISCDLQVTVKEGAPAGYIQEEILLGTSEGADRQIRVMVQGHVVPEIRAGPAALSFGSMAPHEDVTKRLIVSGKKPFRIISAEVDCEGFQFEVPEDGEAKRLHVVPVKFTANDKPGAFAKRIFINTDQGERSASVLAYVNVRAPRE
jgi:hypothetical protein